MLHVIEQLERRLGIDPTTEEQRRRRLAIALSASAAVTGVLVATLSPWTAFGVVIALIGLGVGIARPELLLLALLAYTPFEPFLLKFVPDDLYLFARYAPELVIYLLLALVAYRILTRRARYKSTPLDLPFLALLIVAATSLAINAVPPVIGILGIRQIIRFMLLYFAVVQLDPDIDYIRLATTTMLGIMFFQAALGITQSAAGGALDPFLLPSERKFYESIQLTAGTDQFWSPGTRVFATMGRFDQLGTFLAFFFLIALGIRYASKDAAAKKALGTLVLLCAPGFIMTLSRASWFGFLIGIAVIGGWLMHDWRVRATFLAGIVAAVTYVGITGIAVRYMTDYAGQTPVERLFEAFSYERWRGEYLGLGRLYWIVQTPLKVVPSSPIFGVGPGQFGAGAAAALGNSTVYERLGLPFGVYGTDGYIDNNWFAVWGELGTLGLLFYVWMVAALARTAYETWQGARDPYVRGLALGFLGATLAVSFQALLGTYLEVRTLALYLWTYGAFVYVLARREGVVRRV